MSSKLINFLLDNMALATDIRERAKSLFILIDHHGDAESMAALADILRSAHSLHNTNREMVQRLRTKHLDDEMKQAVLAAVNGGR